MTNIETLLKSLKGSKEGLMFAEILLQHLKAKFKMGVLLYDGDETMPLGDNIWAAPLSTLWGK
jgi:hypothetical protein